MRITFLYPCTMLGSEATRNRPSASITISFSARLASSISTFTDASIAGSLPSPGPITKLCSLGSHGRMAPLVSVESFDLKCQHDNTGNSLLFSYMYNNRYRQNTEYSSQQGVNNELWTVGLYNWSSSHSTKHMGQVCTLSQMYKN